jgi:multisubunit Na+/H+ antiporter MnhF subunit
MLALLADLGSRTAAGIFGFALFIATTMSLMRTVVIPRTLKSVISDTVQRIVVGAFILLARVRRNYTARDGVMAWAGPTTILMQLITWLLLYLVSFGLLIYGVSGQGMGDCMRQAGSSLFTLGFATIDRANQTAIDFAAAATGPIVVALMIGFLPTIYSAYVDREVQVTMLATLAGEP